MGIITNIKKLVKRDDFYEKEELLRQDLLENNKDKLEDLSQRNGLLLNSGLSEAEKQYILSDSIISSAIQLYIADVLSICSKSSCIITSSIDYVDDSGEIAKKEEIVKYIFDKVYSDDLTEAIITSLLNNGEIFLDTKYNSKLNKYIVNESVYQRCTELCFADGSTAMFLVSNQPITDNVETQYNYSYNLHDVKNELVDADKMVRIYKPTISNTKYCIELDENDEEEKEIISTIDENYVFYTNSLSLLKQVYSDWLNSKLLELAVYRDRIAKSRFIQLVAIELGRTSRVTSDQIYDNVKDYFDKRAVIDLEKQTFKSVVGNEPFTDYKVYITRNGNGQLSFDNSLNGASANVASLADLDYNLDKVFAGLGVPKQYLGADDSGSALSNGTSLFFLDEKYQKKVLAYIKRIEKGYKQIIKNLIKQRYSSDNNEKTNFFSNWDFDLKFSVPENNDEVMQNKISKVNYVNSLLELIDKVEEDPNKYNYNKISEILDENIKDILLNLDEYNKESDENSEEA